jgi:hypothetical protein
MAALTSGGYGCGDIGDFLRRVGFINETLSVTDFSTEPRPGANSVKLAFDETLRVAGSLLLKYLEFDARRARVDNKGRVHRRSRSGQGRFVSTRGSVENRRGARSHAAAHGVRPRGKDDRNSRAKHQARGIRLR